MVLFAVLFVALGALAYAGYSVQTRLQQELAKSEEQNKILTRNSTRPMRASLISRTDGCHLAEDWHDPAELAEARSRAEAIRKQQTASDQRLSQEISAAQKESEAKIGAVATDVTAPRRHRIHQKRSRSHKSKLERSMGDMNVMSGLIAHNHDDLEELRRRRPQLLRIHIAESQDAAARWPRSDGPE